MSNNIMNKYSSISKFNSELGISAVTDYDGRSFHVGLDFEPIYDNRFGSVSEMKDGIATVIDLDTGYNYHIGLDGNRLYDEDYLFAGEFSHGLAHCIMKTGYHIFINNKGENAFGTTFKLAQSFKDGVSIVTTLDDDRALVYPDLSISEKRYFRINQFVHGMAVVTDVEDGDEYHMDKNCNKMYDDKFKYVFNFTRDGDDGELLALACIVLGQNTKLVHIRPDGSRLYDGDGFDTLADFKCGAARVFDNDEAYHIGMDGKPLYDTSKFSWVGDFVDGVTQARVKEGIKPENYELPSVKIAKRHVTVSIDIEGNVIEENY